MGKGGGLQRGRGVGEGGFWDDKGFGRENGFFFYFFLDRRLINYFNIKKY